MGGVISRLTFGGDRPGAAKQLCLASPKLRQEERCTEGADEKSRCHASGGHMKTPRKVPSIPRQRHNCCDRHEMAHCRGDECARIPREMEEPACR